MAKKEDAPTTFEDRIAALEAVVRDLEGDELPLEDAIERYRAGVDHLRACRQLLDRAEERLVELVEGADGPTERPLRVGAGGLTPADDVDGDAAGALGDAP